VQSALCVLQGRPADFLEPDYRVSILNVKVLVRCAPNLSFVDLEVRDFSCLGGLGLPASVGRLALHVLGSATVAVSDLVGFLQSSNVTDLVLDFSCFNGESNCYKRGVTTKRVSKRFVLPNITSVELYILVDRRVMSLLACLYFPGVERLSITIIEEDDASDSVLMGLVLGQQPHFRCSYGETLELAVELCGMWFDDGDHYSRLETLSFKMDLDPSRSYDAEFISSYYLDVSKYCPALAHVELNECTPLASALRFPALQTLALKRTHVHGDWLFSYGGKLRSSGMMGAFRSLTLSQCTLGRGRWGESGQERELDNVVKEFEGKVVIICESIIKTQAGVFLSDCKICSTEYE